MKDKKKTKDQLIRELDTYRSRIRKLEFIDEDHEGSLNPFKKKQKIFQTIIESTSDYICLISTEGNFIYTSDSFEQLGYEPGELIDKSAFEYLHPENKDYLFSLMNEYVKCVNIEGVKAKNLPLKRTLYFRFTDKDGEWKDTEATVNLITEEAGNINSFLFLARDITEIKRVEEALKTSEKRFSRMVSNVPGIVYQFALHADGSFSFPYINGRVRDIFGLEPDDVQKNPNILLGLVHPAWSQELFDSILESAKNLTPYDYTGKWDSPKGEKWGRAISRPEKLPNEDILWDGLIIDITERKRAEEALRESEKRFSRMVASVPGIVYQFILHKDGTFTIPYINERIRDYLDLAPKDAEKDPNLIIDKIYPEYRKAFFDAAAESAEKLTPFDFTCTWKVSGEDKWGRAIARPIKLSNEDILWDGLIIDITKQKELERKIRESEESLRERVKERTAEITKMNEKLKEEIAVRKQIEESLRESEERFRDISFNIGDLIWEVDDKGRFTFISENLSKISGYEPEDLIGYKTKELIGQTPLIPILPSEQKTSLKVLFFRRSSKKEPINDLETWVKNKQGDEVCLLTNAVPIINKKGGLKGYRGITQNITKRKKAEEENIRLAAFPRESPNPILSSNADGDIIYMNPTAQRIKEQLKIDIATVLLPKNHEEMIESCLETNRSYQQIEVRIKNRVFSWTYNPITSIKIVHLHGIDISDQKRFEEKLLHDAFHDELTELPNRSLFIDRLGHSIKLAKRNKGYLFAVLFLDMDRFKLVNDSLGHIIGDKVLVEISQKLHGCLRPGDTIARFGGDEFTILLDNISGSADAVRVAKRIQEELSYPLNMKGHEIFSSVSIGIAMSTTGYSRPEDVLRDADTAMFHAKALGISRYVMFDKTMHDQALKLLELESDLQHAIERNEFRVHYQPIISLESNEVIGFEALLRWEHPKRGLILPDEFISTIEETGLIIPIGKWIITQACHQMSTWQKKFPDKSHLFISVNLSARQFLQPDLIDQIKETIIETNLKPGSLKMEITESVIIENYDVAASMLAQLRDMNIQLCIDDFGTGYCSLSHLHHFPIDTLKIDRSFIKAIGEDGENSEIVQTIVTLAHNLGMDVIAEGMEIEEHMSHLKDMGCEFGQGYLFSPALDNREAETLFKKALQMIRGS